MDFWDLIFGTASGYATIVTKDEAGGLTQERFYSYPDERSHMNRFLSTATDDDVYFSPLLYGAKRRIKDNAREATVVYTDADTCHPDNFRLAPSISVETSPGRWHCYWVLDAVYSAEQVSDMSHRIAIAHRSQGCDISGWIRTKLLRVPGTTNTKYDTPFTVTAHYSGEIYTMYMLDNAYEDIEIPERYGSFDPEEDVSTPSDWPAVGPLLERIPAKGEIANLFTSNWQVHPDGTTDRSERRWALINALREEGFSQEETTVVVWASKINKFRDDGRPIEQLFEYEVRKAYAGREVVAVLPEETDAVQPAPLPAPNEDDYTVNQKFLSDEERKNLPRCIVDDYVDWVATRTDSPATYQVANGLMVLSGALSDIAFIAPQFGPMGLNLWFMILGDTTGTRKSTARDLMLQLMHALEHTSIGYEVDIGSDPTRESLVKVLGERDGKTSLIHKDEVQGYFKEQKTKTFMSGINEFFTDVYGGNVPVSIRNDRENKSSGKRAKTNFLLHFMGIPSEVAAAVNLDYFKSGFLARFLYVTAESLPMDENREYVGQDDGIDASGNSIDEGFTSLVKKISAVRTKMRKASGPWCIRMAPDALKRWNRFKYDTALATKGQRFFEAVEPSRQRLAFSVWKAAALIAISAGEREIQLPHLLKAISYAEDWYKNLVLLAGQISSSEWEAFTDEVEMAASTAGKVRYETIARKFPNRKKRELDEAILSLVAQGRVRDLTDSNTQKRFLTTEKAD